MSVQPANRQTVSRLVPVAEAFVAIDQLATPVALRDVDVGAALGRVLAVGVTATRVLPATAIALRDGWAVRSDLLSDAGAYAPALLQPAPNWVEAGDALPDGTDAVVAPHAVVKRDNLAEALEPAVPGGGTLGAGADAGPGEVLLPAGRMIRAIEVAVMRAAGIARVQVRMPQALIIAANAAIGNRDDTVGPFIARAVELDGGNAQFSRVERGGEIALAHSLSTADADVVIGIGGTGVGRRDASVQALARAGKVAIHGVGLIPGDTAAIGSIGARPVVLLPGRLDAALAAYLVLGRRVLSRLTGRTDVIAGSHMTLARKIVSTVGMTEVIPVRRRDGGIEPVATGYFPLQAMARADGYVLVPAASEGYVAGSVVEMWPLP
jgi:molybdopterin molybdotransferase